MAAPRDPLNVSLADVLGDPSILAHHPANKLGRFWLVVALVVLLGLVGVSAWRQGWFTPTANLYIDLPGASGVQVGTPVKLKGFKIGEVAALHLEPNLNVRVRIKIVLERMPLLATDASAHFGRDGPIGGKYIDINPGARGPVLLQAESTLPMETGSELDDVMATVKVAVDKLAIAISKVDPILDDTKKLTGEASAVSTDVRTSLSLMMNNMAAISGQLKRVGDTATSLTANADKDRAHLVGDLRKILATASQLTDTAQATLTNVDKQVPILLGKAQQSATDVNAITRDASQITRDATLVARDATQISRDAKTLSGEAVVELPPALRAGRAAAEDAARITDGAKKTWPISTMVPTAPESHLPLDGFEGSKP
jgi:phospholipid/cholesterol/gamma-HCH transport system substrate-binding protein